MSVHILIKKEHYENNFISYEATIRKLFHVNVCFHSRLLKTTNATAFAVTKRKKEKVFSHNIKARIWKSQQRCLVKTAAAGFCPEKEANLGQTCFLLV